MSILLVKEREGLTDVREKVGQKFPDYTLKIDHSLGFTPDAFREMQDPEKLMKFFTIRFDTKGGIRIPAAKRTPIYVSSEVRGETGVIYRTDRSSETEKGYCIIDSLVVCHFRDLGVIITSPELGPRMRSEKDFEKELSLLDRIYGKISESSIVSVYFSNKVILGC